MGLLEMGYVALMDGKELDEEHCGTAAQESRGEFGRWHC